MRRLFTVLFWCVMMTSGHAYGMSDSDKKEYLEWIRDLGSFDGALAMAPNGCWRARHGHGLYSAKKKALKDCEKQCQSATCKIVDSNGTSAFIKQKANTLASTNHSPSYYKFYGTVTPLSQIVTNKIRPEYIWECTTEQQWTIEDEPQESDKSTFRMATYSENNRIKWRIEGVGELAGTGFDADLGLDGAVLRDLSVVGYLSGVSEEQITAARMIFQNLYGHYVGSRYRQGQRFRYGENVMKMYLKYFVTDISELKNFSGLSNQVSNWFDGVVLGETIINGRRALVLGNIVNFDLKNLPLAGLSAHLEGVGVGYQLIDLASGIPINHLIELPLTVKVDAKNRKLRAHGIEKRKCVLENVVASAKPEGEAKPRQYELFWCATSKHVYFTTQSHCLSDGGKVYTTKQRAESEYKRLKGSTPDPTPQSRTWCATKNGVFQTTKENCKARGKSFSYKWQAEEEHNRLKDTGKPKGPPRKLIGTGTGFVIDKNYVVTAEHVVNECNEVKIKYHHETIGATVVGSDPNNDLGLLKIDQSIHSVAKLARGGLTQGQRVANYGYPLFGQVSTSATSSEGHINNLSGINNDSRFFQFDATTQPGNSGGPVLDASANVVGVAVHILSKKYADKSGHIAQNVNFAVKSYLVEGFLSANDVSFQKAESNERLELADIAKKAKTFTVLVGCWE
jgi:S1-C subfamily serine protease